MSCSLVDNSINFENLATYTFRKRKFISSTLKMDAAVPSAMFLHIYQATRLHISEDRNLIIAKFIA
jgi:hypothetical protein